LNVFFININNTQTRKIMFDAKYIKKVKITV